MTHSGRSDYHVAVLLGFTVPNSVAVELIESDPHPPHQTHNFAHTLVTCLEKAGFNVKAVSSLPVSSFPASPIFVARGGEFICESGLRGRYLPFVNLPLVKHVSRLWSLTSRAGRQLRSRQTKFVLVHGVHSPYLLYAAYLKLRHGKRIVAVLTDPPGVVLRSDGPFLRKMKALDKWIVRFLLARFDGAVVLTEELGQALLRPETPTMVIEGLVSSDLVNFARDSRSSSPKIVYAGGLSSGYGVDTLLAAVRAMECQDVVAHFFGAGESSGIIAEAALEDERIRGPYRLSREQLLNEYKDAWLLVQPRPIDTHQDRQSFPSKMLEYMATGVPVGSTALSGMPAEYEGLYYPLDHSSSAIMGEQLDAIIDCLRDHHEDVGAEARKVLLKHRAPAAIAPGLRRFLQLIDSN